MPYEINVIKDGKHFFAIDQRSIRNTEELKPVLAAIRAAFTGNQGYQIQVYNCEEVRRLENW